MLWYMYVSSSANDPFNCKIKNTTICEQIEKLPLDLEGESVPDNTAWTVFSFVSISDQEDYKKFCYVPF